MLQADYLVKKYGTISVLKNVSLLVQEKEIVAITGPSGAGKTTLLQILGTLEKPDTGTVSLAGVAVSSLSGSKLATFRNQKIGFIFQFHNLLPEFSAIENVMLPGLIAGKSTSVVKQSATKLLEMLGLGHRLTHAPSALSGGEQQRVAVARALVNQPTIVLADEPSGNLDSENARALHELFFELREQLGHTFVIVTHNEHLAEMADRQIKMKDGTIIN